jgi:hypothetical protein
VAHAALAVFRVSDSPSQRSSVTTGSNSHVGNQTFQSRNGSAIRVAANSTIASTVQLKITPK